MATDFERKFTRKIRLGELSDEEEWRRALDGYCDHERDWLRTTWKASMKSWAQRAEQSRAGISEQGRSEQSKAMEELIKEAFDKRYQ